MNMLLVRPRVADLVFQLYGKPLHPELFDILAVRKMQVEGYQVRIWITRTGHVISFENDDVLLTEVADVDQAFSDKRRFLNYRMRGEHSVSEDVFHYLHDEILADGSKRGILHNFQPNHRLAIAPLGYVVVEAKRTRLHLTTFHTFPEENTIIKSQTLIEKTP
jgi:Protein of unknown function DUF2617